LPAKLVKAAMQSLRPPSTSGSSGSSSSSSTSSSSSDSGSSSSSSDESEEQQITDETKSQLFQAKREYRDLKCKLFQSIKENEILTDELRRQQRKLLRLNRDKYFLFERLISYEKPPTKQAAPKEETIEIVDGVPKVVRVGKKRGPKPKKREPDSPPMLHFPSGESGGYEPGQSLLKLKGSTTAPPGSSPVRKRLKKKDKNNGSVYTDLAALSPTTAATSSSSSPPVTFSPGFSKNRTASSSVKSGGSSNGKKSPQKASASGSGNIGKSGLKKSHSSPTSLLAQPPPQPELSNSTTQDSVLSFKSGDGGPPRSSAFFRHDSFSNEMPENLFDD